MHYIYTLNTLSKPWSSIASRTAMGLHIQMPYKLMKSYNIITIWQTQFKQGSISKKITTQFCNGTNQDNSEVNWYSKPNK